MTRCSLFVAGALTLLISGSLEAQHHHGTIWMQTTHVAHHPHFFYPMQNPVGMIPPSHSHHCGHRHFSLSSGYFPQPVQPFSYPAPVYITPFFTPIPVASSNAVRPPSSPAARLKSLELLARGDQRMREQKWSEARVAYADATNLAPDRAIGYLKLGLCHAAMQRYETAIHEIKHALTLDPTIPQTGESLEKLFGPNSQIIRNSIVSKLGDWVQHDSDKSDRLFLYGVVLHFNGDTRGREMFEAARRKKSRGEVKHIALFLRDGGDELDREERHQLNHRPMPLLFDQPNTDLRFPKAPTPMPNGPVPMP